MWVAGMILAGLVGLILFGIHEINSARKNAGEATAALKAAQAQEADFASTLARATTLLEQGGDHAKEAVQLLKDLQMRQGASGPAGPRGPAGRSAPTPTPTPSRTPAPRPKPSPSPSPTPTRCVLPPLCLPVGNKGGAT
jgi:Sec-independent protein translocase protein TatA